MEFLAARNRSVVYYMYTAKNLARYHPEISQYIVVKTDLPMETNQPSRLVRERTYIMCEQQARVVRTRLKKT